MLYTQSFTLKSMCSIIYANIAAGISEIFQVHIFTVLFIIKSNYYVLRTNVQLPLVSQNYANCLVDMKKKTTFILMISRSRYCESTEIWCSPKPFRSWRPVSMETSQISRKYYSAQVCAQAQVHLLFPHYYKPMGRIFDMTGKRSGFACSPRHRIKG